MNSSFLCSFSAKNSAHICSASISPTQLLRKNLVEYLVGFKKKPTQFFLKMGQATRNKTFSLPGPREAFRLHCRLRCNASSERVPPLAAPCPSCLGIRPFQWEEGKMMEGEHFFPFFIFCLVSNLNGVKVIQKRQVVSSSGLAAQQ